MNKFRDGLLGPTLILLAICFVITFALAFTYQTTKPAIEAGNVKAANDARAEVLPGGGTFTKIEGAALPEGVDEAYQGTGGYVFTSHAKGFDGQVTYMIGIYDNGEVAGIKMFDHNETPGLGTKVGDEDYLKQYYGGTDPSSVDAVTGATKTSNSLKNSIKQAKEAFEAVKGAR